MAGPLHLEPRMSMLTQGARFVIAGRSYMGRVWAPGGVWAPAPKAPDTQHLTHPQLAQDSTAFSIPSGQQCDSHLGENY